MPIHTTIAERARRLWDSRADAPSASRAPEVAEQVAALESRVQHLEAALEGLQDAVHRRAVIEDEHIDELRKRTEPGQIARDLSRDARRRGL